MKKIMTHNRAYSANGIKTLFVVPFFVITTLTIFSFSGCGKKDAAGSGAQSEVQVPVFAVNTITATRGQIRDYIPLSGDIISGSTVDVYSDAAGKIAQIYVSVGQRISRGQRIAAVDPSRPGMTYQWGYATAPISGTVVALPAQVGMTIAQSIPLARVAGSGALEIRLYIAERFISKMALNLPCEITLDAWPGEVFQGSIRELAPTVDPASRTMEVRVNVSNEDSKLKAGMFAKVRVITGQKENIVKIPAQAVLNRFGEQYVFVIATDGENPEQRIAKKAVIQPGILIDGVMEIQSGLSVDDEVIVRGQTLLDDGARVNVVDRFSSLSAN